MNLHAAMQLVAGGGTVAASGFGVWRLLLWLTNRFDKRQAQLDAGQNALDMSWKAYRLFLEQERQELRQRMDTMEGQNRALRLAFEHVAGGLIRIDPAHPSLHMAERLLHSAFGDDLTVLAARAEAAVAKAQARGGAK